MSLRVKGIVVFLAIAFGGTWSYLLVARLGFGLSLVNPLVQLPGAFLPAVAALVVRRWVTREGFADAGLRLRRHRTWLAAWLLPIAATALMFGLAAAFGWWRPGGGLGIVVVALVAALVLAPLYWGEEFGWTSFLWPRLVPGRPMASMWATGAVWAVWHYPLAFLGYTELPDYTVSLGLWSATFVLYEVMLVWLYARSGSVWVPTLAHAGNNMVGGLLSEELFTVLDDRRVLICTVLALAIVCLPMLRSRVFARPHQPLPATVR